MPEVEDREEQTPGEPLALRDFRAYWYGDAIGALGLAITPVIVDVLVVTVLQASETEVGLVRAAQFLPYLVVGLLAGAYVDRWRRRPTLVVTNIAQGLLLLLVPALYLLDMLSIASLALVLFAAGAFAVFTAAAEQSYLPDLVPRRLLIIANARIGQSGTVAQTSGPAVGGALVGALSAPLAMVLSSLSRFASAVLVLRIRRPEPEPDRDENPRIWRAIRDGLGFMYGHRTLAPLAASTHVWFLANSMALTVFALLALRDLGLSAAVYGMALSLAGVGGFAGAMLAPALGRRAGEGRAILLCRERDGLLAGGHAQDDARPRERDEALGEPDCRRTRRTAGRCAGRCHRLPAHHRPRGDILPGRGADRRAVTAAPGSHQRTR